MNRPDSRRACIPSSNGIATAKAIARLYAALLPGGVDGVELLSPFRVRLASESQKLNDGTLIDMGLGYFLGERDPAMGYLSHAFGHGGYGGSIAFADPHNQLAFGLVKNRLSDHKTALEILQDLEKVGLG
jgi:CubicO group peptidase (beta-lactamase class C family)